MQIDLMRAFTPDCMAERECWICDSTFTAKVIAIFGGPHGEQMCDDCFLVLAKRMRDAGNTDCPAPEFYEEALITYAEPLFESNEECSRAEDLGLFYDFESLAYIT